MSFNSKRMYEEYSIGATTSYQLVSPPPYLTPPFDSPPNSDSNTGSSCRLRSLIRILFFAFLSLATLCIILSEVLLSYPRMLLSFMMRDIPSGIEVVQTSKNLKIIEYHTRANASVFAFGALVFMWYKLFLVILKGLVKLRRYLRSSSSPPASVAPETRSFASRVYLPFLLTVIIINDSIFNRPQPTISSSLPAYPLSPPVDVILETIPMKLMLIFPSFLVRLSWMAIRALPVSAIVAWLVFIILYTVGWSSSSSSSGADVSEVGYLKMQELEHGLGSGFEIAPPVYNNDATPAYLEAALVQLYYVYPPSGGKKFSDENGMP